jgi:undecaprenyl-diphosphatase
MVSLGIFETIVLGAVEGLTEFLPISSTAHLMLTGWLLGLESTEFKKSFDIVIQLGAILAVALIYWRRVLQDWSVIKKIAVAFLPTGVLGLIFYSLIKQYLLGSMYVPLVTLFLGGLFLVLFEAWRKRQGDKDELADFSQITYKQCLVIGLCQSVAMVPGVSRAAATIVGGLLLGMNRRLIVEFSFLLAIPTMAAATGLDLIKSYGTFERGDLLALALGLVVAFVTAWVAVKWLLNYVSKHDFSAFGWYRMALVVVIVAWLVL